MILFKNKKNKNDEDIVEPFLEDISLPIKISILIGVVLLVIFFIWLIFFRNKISSSNISKKAKLLIKPVKEKFPIGRSESNITYGAYVNPLNPYF